MNARIKDCRIQARAVVKDPEHIELSIQDQLLYLKSAIIYPHFQVIFPSRDKLILLINCPLDA